MSRWAARVVLSAALVTGGVALGCDKSPSFEEIERTNTALTTDVKAETGRDALVSFYKDGFDLTITGTLVETSEADAEQAKPKIDAIVKRHWPKANKIVVAAQPK